MRKIGFLWKSVVDCEIWAKVICIVGRKNGMQQLHEATDAYEALIFTTEQDIHFYGEKA